MKSFQSSGFLVVSAILSVRGSEREAGWGGAGIWPVEGARATYSRELKKEGTRRRVGSWKQESGRGRCHKGWDFRSGVDGFGGRSELDRPKR